MTANIIDYRGLKCPLPALLAKRMLGRLPAGAQIEILTDDPMAPIDIPHMCRQEGFIFVAITREGDGARMVLKRPIPEPQGQLPGSAAQTAR
jgi:tRNA 2-thiouridine synthesizing protein A